MFLRGLLPDALLSQYTFWQNEDDTIIGYQIIEYQQKLKTGYALRITLSESADKGAMAKVVRVPLKNLAMGKEQEEIAFQQFEEERSVRQNETNTMMLLNLMYAPCNTPLGRLCDYLLKVETLAWCLAWTKDLSRGVASAQCQVCLGHRSGIQKPILLNSFLGR